MGHYVECLDFPLSTSLKEIQEEVINTMRDNGDRAVFPPKPRLIDRPIFASYDEAYDWAVNQLGSCIVKYRDCNSVEPNKKMLEIMARIEENGEMLRHYKWLHSVQLKTAYTGCPGCGSRLDWERLSWRLAERCPLCGTDLRSATVKTQLDALQQEYKELRAKLTEETKKNGANAPVRFLVKFGYHI